MPAPSKTITSGDRGAASLAPDDIGSLFAAGTSTKGPSNVAVDCRSVQAVRDVFGDGALIRHAIQYFGDGGTRFVGTRATGPSAATALVQIPGASGNTLVATANGSGVFANGAAGGYSITIANGPTGSSTRVVILKLNGVEVTRTLESTIEAGLTGVLGATSTADGQVIGGVTISLGAGSGLPTVAATLNLAGGLDDNAGITITEKTTAINAASSDLGAGSVSYPGDTTAAVHAALRTAARATNRYPLLDGLDSASETGNISEAATLRANILPPYGQLLAPWEKIPYAGTTIVVPPSPSQAGRMARADLENRSGPGQPAAGRFAISRLSTDVTQTYTRAQLDSLADAGVTVIRNIRGQVQASDALTLADPNVYPQYAEANGERVLMAIKSECSAILDGYLLQLIDGKRHILVALAADLTGVCKRWYERDALYGDTPDEAFQVDTGPGINPDSQLAARKIAAQIELRTSPFVRFATVNITKVASGDTI